MARSMFTVAATAFTLGALGASPAAAQVAAGAAWNVTSGQAASSFGASVTSAGDVNGDGYDDAIVGAPSFANGQSFEGRAFVYHGSASGLATTPAWTFESNVSFAELGAVAGAGDVDGDGFDDVIVGAKSYDGAAANAGRAWWFRGSATGLSLTPSWSVEGTAFAAFGSSVAGAGDVDGDGFDDLVVGAPGVGRCYVFLGSATGPSPVADATLIGSAGSNFGISVAGAGDVNGDGHDDVIVGANQHASGQSNEGLALVYLGSPGGLSTTAAWSAESDAVNALLGSSVDGAGDVNGDGYDDVIVGAPHLVYGGKTFGDAFVFLGGARGLALTPAWNPGPQQEDSGFGTGVAGAGDVNGDGFHDVIVGAHSFNAATINDGRGYVFLGSASGLPAIADWSARGHTTHVYFGLAVGGAGDVNGDGLADVILGGHNFDNGQQRAWVFHGCSGCAAAAPYHPGKPDLLFPRLNSDAPVLGGTATLTLLGGAPVVPVFLLLGAAPAVLPFDGGALLVQPLLTVTLPPTLPNGSLTLPVALPPDAGLTGLDVYFQMLFVTPGASGPKHTVQTNGVHWTLGS